MKKLLFFVAALAVSATVQAQDVIVTYDAEEIAAKITEIGETQIKYKKASNPDGPSYTMNIANVVMVRFENGEIETFKTQKDAMSAQRSAAQVPANTVTIAGTPVGSTYATTISGVLNAVPGGGYYVLPANISADQVDFHGNVMSAGGIRLSEEQIKKMFNSEAIYERWRRGCNLYRTGDIFAYIGAVPLGAGLGLFCGGAGAGSDSVMITGIALMAASNIFFIPAIVFQCVGTSQKAAAMREWREGLASTSVSPQIRFGVVDEGIGMSIRF